MTPLKQGVDRHRDVETDNYAAPKSGPPPVNPDELSAFRRDLLRTIARIGPSSGVEIETSLEEIYPPLGHSRVYAQLDRLVEDGLVDKSDRDGRTHEYRLTDRGRNVVRWLALEWDRSSTHAIVGDRTTRGP